MKTLWTLSLAALVGLVAGPTHGDAYTNRSAPAADAAAPLYILFN